MARLSGWGHHMNLVRTAAKVPLAILVACAMALGMAQVAHADGAISGLYVGTWADLAHELRVAAAGETIEVMDEITYKAGNEPIVVTASDITIKLNGHTISRAATSPVGDGAVITVRGGELTLEGGGTITGGNNSSGAGGIVVGPDSGSKLTVTDGISISGNKGTTGGGVYVAPDCTFAMKNVTITGNTATKGGGVYVAPTCTFSLGSGSITGNTATTGGGVYVASADGGACEPIRLGEGSSSLIKIADNTGGNLYYCKGATAFLVLSLAGGSRIGVSVEDSPANSSKVRAFSPYDDPNNAPYYFSDDPRCAIRHSVLGNGNTCMNLVSSWEMAQTSDGAAYEVTKYQGANTETTIPSTWLGKPVTSIGPQAFSASITSVTIPESVTTIGIRAFVGCTKLSTVTIEGNGLTSIGDYAFSNCVSLTTLRIPKSVVSIGFAAFGTHEGEIFYGGTQEEWDAIAKSNDVLRYKKLHCVPNDGVKAKKLKNTLVTKGKKPVVKLAKLKKKPQVVKRAKAMLMQKAKGKVSYKLKVATKKGAGSKKFTKYFKVSKKTGNITVKTGLKKGTYKVKVAVTAAGTHKYKKLTKVATVTVRVK